jgi:hypothetical protein
LSVRWWRNDGSPHRFRWLLEAFVHMYSEFCFSPCTHLYTCCILCSYVKFVYKPWYASHLVHDLFDLVYLFSYLLYDIVVDDIYEHHAILYGCPLVVMKCCSSISFLSSSLVSSLVSMLLPSCISYHDSFVIYLGGWSMWTFIMPLFSSCIMFGMCSLFFVVLGFLYSYAPCWHVC